MPARLDPAIPPDDARGTARSLRAPVLLRLEGDEALLLFDLLWRRNISAVEDVSDQGKIDRAVFNALEARLEKLVPEVVSEDFKGALEGSRRSFGARLAGIDSEEEAKATLGVDLLSCSTCGALLLDDGQDRDEQRNQASSACLLWREEFAQLRLEEEEASTLAMQRAMGMALGGGGLDEGSLKAFEKEAEPLEQRRRFVAELERRRRHGPPERRDPATVFAWRARVWQARAQHPAMQTSGEALAALKLWAHGKKLDALVAAHLSASLAAARDGWYDAVLAERAACMRCGTSYRLENLGLCTSGDGHHICHACQPGSRQCMCGGEFVG